MEGGLNYKTGHMYYEMNLVPHLSTDEPPDVMEAL